MEELKNNFLVCEKCGNTVKDDDEFCPDCGMLFIEGANCVNHVNIFADGVCIICTVPYCNNCGGTVNNIFLCNEHYNYEIFENMARVYGCLSDASAQFAKTCLEQSGFHPVLFCRQQVYGGPRFVYSLFEAAGDYRGNIVSEIKVMVPVQEVLEAEKVLRSNKFLE